MTMNGWKPTISLIHPSIPYPPPADAPGLLCELSTWNDSPGSRGTVLFALPIDCYYAGARLGTGWESYSSHGFEYQSGTLDLHCNEKGMGVDMKRPQCLTSLDMVALRRGEVDINCTNPEAVYQRHSEDAKIYPPVNNPQNDLVHFKVNSSRYIFDKTVPNFSPVTL